MAEAARRARAICCARGTAPPPEEFAASTGALVVHTRSGTDGARRAGTVKLNGGKRVLGCHHLPLHFRPYLKPQIDAGHACRVGADTNEARAAATRAAGAARRATARAPQAVLQPAVTGLAGRATSAALGEGGGRGGEVSDLSFSRATPLLQCSHFPPARTIGDAYGGAARWGGGGGRCEERSDSR